MTQFIAVSITAELPEGFPNLMDGLSYLETLMDNDIANQTEFQDSILKSVLPEVKKNFQKTSGELRELMNSDPENPMFQMSAMNMSIGWNQLEKVSNRYESGILGMPCKIIPNSGTGV